MTSRKVVEAATNIAIVRLIGEANPAGGVFEAHAERSAIKFDGDRRRRNGPALGVVLDLPVSGRRRLVYQQPRRPGGPDSEMDPPDVGRHRPNLDWHCRAAIVLRNDLDPMAARGNAWDTRDRSRVAGGKIARRSCRFGRYQPRWIHSSRCGRSRPMVVGLPWPGSTL